MASGAATAWVTLGRILLLWLAGLGAAGQFAKMAVILPDLAVIYPDRPAALGFLVSLISLTGVVLGLAAGGQVARLGPRRMLLGALWFGAAVSALQTALPPLALMLGLRVLEGLAHLVIVVAAPTLIATLAPGRARAAALSLWSTFFGVAFALAAVTLPGLVAARGVPAAFVAHALWMVASALALSASLPRSAAPLPAPAPAVPQPKPGALRDVYGLTPSAAPALGWLFYTLAFVALVTVLPLRLPSDQARLAATWMPLAGIAVSLVIGVPLLRHVPAVKVAIAGFALALALTIWLAASPDRAAPAIAIFAVLGLVQGASFAAVPQVNATDAARARANGAIAQTGNLGNLIGTPLLLAITGAAGDTGLAAFAGCAFAAGLVLHLVCARRAIER